MDTEGDRHNSSYSMHEDGTTVQVTCNSLYKLADRCMQILHNMQCVMFSLLSLDLHAFV